MLPHHIILLPSEQQLTNMDMNNTNNNGRPVEITLFCQACCLSSDRNRSSKTFKGTMTPQVHRHKPKIISRGLTRHINSHKYNCHHHYKAQNLILSRNLFDYSSSILSAPQHISVHYTPAQLGLTLTANGPLTTSNQTGPDTGIP